MLNFEITGVGFDASTDKTDHRVIWVTAPSMSDTVDAVGDAPYDYIGPLESMPSVDVAIDFTLPQDAEALRARLFSYATPEQRLVDLLERLLDCSDLQLERLEEDTVEVMAKARTYLDDNYTRNGVRREN